MKVHCFTRPSDRTGCLSVSRQLLRCLDVDETGSTVTVDQRLQRESILRSTLSSEQEEGDPRAA